MRLSLGPSGMYGFKSSLSSLGEVLGLLHVLSIAVIVSSSRSHSFSVMGNVEGTMMSTAPLAMLVMAGGVAVVRLRTVG